MSAIDITMYEKKKSRLFSFALIFLLAVILLSISMYLYLLRIQSINTNLRSDTSTIENSIAEIEKDPKVQVYKIYAQNTVFLQHLAENSNIPAFVSHLKKTFRKYNLDAQGFSYTAGNIALQVKGQTNDAGYAYEKVVKFLKEYNTQTQEKTPFILKKVTSFSGYDTIAYAVEFEVKK